MTKRLWIGAGAVGVVLAGLLAVLVLAGRSVLDRERFGAVRAGMTRAEVERVLGGPPRNECRDRVDVWVPRAGRRTSAELVPGPVAIRFFPGADGEEAVWVGEKGLIAVRFGPDGRLRETYVSDVVGPDESLLGGAVRRLVGREAARRP